MCAAVHLPLALLRAHAVPIQRAVGAVVCWQSQHGAQGDLETWLGGSRMASLAGTGAPHTEWEGEKANGFPGYGGGSGAAWGAEERDCPSPGVQALKQQLLLPRGWTACWKHPHVPPTATWYP